MRVEVSVGIDVASTWNVRRLTIAGNAEEESHFHFNIHNIHIIFKIHILKLLTRGET